MLESKRLEGWRESWTRLEGWRAGGRAGWMEKLRAGELEGWRKSWRSGELEGWRTKGWRAGGLEKIRAGNVGAQDSSGGKKPEGGKWSAWTLTLW